MCKHLREGRICDINGNWCQCPYAHEVYHRRKRRREGAGP